MPTAQNNQYAKVAFLGYYILQPSIIITDFKYFLKYLKEGEIIQEFTLIFNVI